MGKGKCFNYECFKSKKDEELKEAIITAFKNYGENLIKDLKDFKGFTDNLQQKTRKAKVELLKMSIELIEERDAIYLKGIEHSIDVVQAEHEKMIDDIIHIL